ncbi:MAG: Ig-like domain-containing protein, partial [Candidatus Kapaibacterium sp.]
DNTPRLEGTVTSGSSVSITMFDGAVVNWPATVDGTDWYYDVTTSLADGTHTFTATGERLGSTTSVTGYVAIDATVPVLAYSSPSFTTLTGPTVQGTINDNDNSATITVSITGPNGYSWSGVANNNMPDWDVTIGSALVDDGTYDVTVDAVDPAGNTDQITDSFDADVNAPEVTVDEFETNIPTIVLTGTIEDADPNPTIVVTVGGTDYNATRDAGMDTWATDAAITLSSGENTVDVTATDWGARVGMATGSVTYTPPSAEYNVTAVADSEAGDIAATNTSEVEVWAFSLNDDVTGNDGLAANVDAITIQELSMGDLDEVLQNAAIYDGATKVMDASAINATSIEFDGGAGSAEFSAASGESKTYTLRIELASSISVPVDNKQFQFQITEDDVTTSTIASTLKETSFTATSAIAGDENTVVVEGTEMRFTQQYSSTVGYPAIDEGPTVIVSVTDANGNVDADIDNLSIDLTASAVNITGGGTVSTVDGEAEFTDLEYSAPTDATTITASATGYTDITSNQFHVKRAEPSQATNIRMSTRSRYMISIAWNSGGGSERIVIAKQGTSISSAEIAAIALEDEDTALDAADFTYNDAGAQLIYRGTGNTATLAGLERETDYTFVVLEFNQTGTNYLQRNFNHSTSSENVITIQTSQKDAEMPDVEVRDFNLSSDDNKVFVGWETTVENDNVGFNLYRAEMTAKGLTEFTQIAGYQNNAELVGLGNSAFGKEYNFVDSDPALQIGHAYVYRLVSVASDGFTEVQAENGIEVVGKSIEVSEVSPNPAKYDINLTLNVFEQKEIRVEIVDMVGKVVAVPVAGNTYGPGAHSLNIPLDNTISAGTYNVRVLAGNEELILRRFVVVK